MQYIARFVGGPCDGRSEDLLGEHYTTKVGRQLVQSGLINLAVYEYEESQEFPDGVDRIYRFRKTLPFADATDCLRDSRTI